MMHKRLIQIVIALACTVILACSQGDHYLTTDPAIREMLISLDMPRSPTGSPASTPPSVLPVSNYPAQNVAGSWQLQLMNGQSIGLALSQSGGVVFGRGSLTAPGRTEWTTASGFVSGSVLRLDVVPESGAALYAIALDVSGQAPSGTYSIYSSGMAAPSSGTVRGSRLPSSA